MEDLVISIRIIAGTARGRTIEVPPGFEIRPTLNRVREALFNILMPRIPESRFLDLFAGSGANGIEALSRGAIQATFGEESAASLRILRANLTKVGFVKKAHVVHATLPKDAHLLLGGGKGYDIIFADPPYRYEDYHGLGDAIAAHRLLNADGVVVIEHHADSKVTDELGPFKRDRIAKYGEVRLSFYY